MVWWWLLLRKCHSWALSLTVNSDASSSSHFCLVSLSLGAILWLSVLLVLLRLLLDLDTYGGEGKVFYGQEPPSGESTTTEFGVSYKLLAVNIEVAQWQTPSCSRPQPATDNGVRDGRSN